MNNFWRRKTVIILHHVRIFGLHQINRKTDITIQILVRLTGFRKFIYIYIIHMKLIKKI